MITKTKRIELHCICHFYFYITIEHLEIRRSLIEITGMKKQHISFTLGTADTIYICRLFYNAAMALKAAVSLRLYMAMSIINVKNRKILG